MPEITPPPHTALDDAIYEAVINARDSVMAQQTILTSGAGKAYQSVAQTAAIAIQDAADSLRNISTIATTAAGVALAQYLATGDESYGNVLKAAQSVMSNATTDFKSVGDAATHIMNNFKSG